MVALMPFPATRQAMQETGYKRECYARCKGCRQPIEWWHTPTGARIPMEWMGQDDSPAVSHWSTCPKAEDFRRSPTCNNPDDSPPPLFSSAPPQPAVKKPKQKGSE
jgi:hypothetical protein